MKVFITRIIPEAAEKFLTECGFDVTVYKQDKPIPRSTLIKNCRDADGIITLLTDTIDRDIIDAMKQCKVIANYAVGYNNIDVAYAKEKGIRVTNTPDILTDATADLAMALVLACARRLPEGDELTRSGKFKGWKPELLLGKELRDKYFAVIGTGRIGAAVAKRARAFGCKILYYNRSKNEHLEKELQARKATLKQICRHADIISLHLPLSEKTKHLIGKAELEQMKDDVIFINTARGEIVDEKALISTLKKHKGMRAGFDVYENEPDLNPKLFTLDNAILLPHIGSATEDTRTAMAELAAKNVAAVLSGKKPITPVN